MGKTLHSLPTIYPGEIARKGEELYQERAPQLEKKHRGEFAAIEVDSGKYFIGKTQQEALAKAKKRFPKNIFYFVRIGFPGVITLSSSYRPVAYEGIL